MRDLSRLRGALVSGGVALAAFAVIARALVTLSGPGEGLSREVSETASSVGISNQVTAVLLDFRGYDTLLEIGVLMLATVTVLSLRESPRVLHRPISDPASPVLGALTKILVPLSIVVAAHLTWIGSSQPGGAFQAGAVLGAAGILLALSGFARPQWASRRTMRVILAVGLLTFLAIAVLAIAVGGNLLEYPDGTRKQLILVTESWLTLSIGASLAILFLSSASADQGGDR
jgi:multisubunit Na+/H+ antiporter MnhB subunit